MTKILGTIALIAGLNGVAVRAETPAPTPQQVWLNTHNAERAEFGVAPLRWSDDLAGEAAGWAQRLGWAFPAPETGRMSGIIHRSFGLKGVRPDAQ
jgi:hypothetical protein